MREQKEEGGKRTKTTMDKSWQYKRRDVLQKRTK